MLVKSPPSLNPISQPSGVHSLACPVVVAIADQPVLGHGVEFILTLQSTDKITKSFSKVAFFWSNLWVGSNLCHRMNVLLKSLPEVETHFGKKATIAISLLDMVNEGERAFGFLLGSMDAGFDVTVGFFNDKARYAAFKKRSATFWNEEDIRSILSQIGRFADWSYKAGSDFFDYTEKHGDDIVAEAMGWQTPARTYAFVYVANVDGEIGIAPDKNALDQKAGN